MRRSSWPLRMHPWGMTRQVCVCACACACACVCVCVCAIKTGRLHLLWVSHDRYTRLLVIWGRHGSAEQRCSTACICRTCCTHSLIYSHSLTRSRSRSLSRARMLSFSLAFSLSHAFTDMRCLQTGLCRAAIFDKLKSTQWLAAGIKQRHFASLRIRSCPLFCQ